MRTAKNNSALGIRLRPDMLFDVIKDWYILKALGIACEKVQIVYDCSFYRLLNVTNESEAAGKMVSIQRRVKRLGRTLKTFNDLDLAWS
ncbi:hypothetical protein PoB_002825400 [Plakobranchus ocellatus]|uniref:Uncharacterized protein n=1 Tax=Plakobranchus ocellatus TaxID=259542 RepID=A0AAV4A586_9GAST|nr:hypothetical protein PoB_002825400 [Plakobranchus ocellatus]